MRPVIDPKADLTELVAISRHYGADPEFVIAGGGNTSLKTAEVLYVKGSGTSLGSITPEGFVAMDRAQLQAILETPVPADAEVREERFKAAVLAARLYPERGQRPSVESVIHHLMPARLVVHTHATWINMFACAVGGEAAAREVLGDDVLWIPYVDPGHCLAQSVAKALADYQQRTGRRECPVIVLDNHGLIVAADDAETIRQRTDRIVAAAKARVGLLPAAPAPANIAALATLAPALRGLLGTAARLPVVCHVAPPEVLAFVADPASPALTDRGPLTPDQIVYCQSYPLWVGADADLATLRAAVADYRERRRCEPKVILVPGVGMLAVADTPRDASIIGAVYTDAIRVMLGASRLGGVDVLTDAQRTFIETWEVEAYRKKVSAAAGTKAGRAVGRVALVTGAAQGFGLEIAQGLAAEGAVVVLADINADKAAAEAAALVARHGHGVAAAVAMNVAKEESVAAAIAEVVRLYGGLDVLVANAGVLRAGSVKQQALRDFEFVTAVNYTGYFLCVRAAAPVMALQHQACAGWWGDIIQINSKSGLVGSNRNAAYAGSKFGGIGLTQSFALELVEDGIKVNSVCPGNFFDGPLWSDPENGLFVQYLRTNKVPGARTIADVRRFYEDKIPMRRGCTTPDVLKAILYLMEQEYETGQALPVTGGQVMLA